MARIYLCFLWHMHQPFYKDLATGEYRLPWTRMHALKDYYGMARILDEFPWIHQTFNLVPSMMVQVDEYARGVANDPFLRCALKPTERLTETEIAFLLQNSFHADPERLIYRHPRYGELYDLRTDPKLFGVSELRDLQVWSQLAWFDEDFFENDPGVQSLVTKGRHFTFADQQVVARKQRELIGLVLPTYKRLAESGRIEISTTPFYHPILPLLCDSDIASVSHPNVPLPSRFRYPGDARAQLDMSREYITREMGASPAGLWPSEGSVSDEVFSIAAQSGFRWVATDSGILDRTLGHGLDVDALYRPYVWRQGDRQLHVVFRDHFLSDRIGFDYSKTSAADAAEDLLRSIAGNCQGFLDRNEDALVPVILDGENAWEYYDRNGRPFLRELYRRISHDPRMTAATISEALDRIEARPLDHIFPGSWINANFDVWIGAEEDNQAWEHLLKARKAYDEAVSVPEAKRRLAFEELLIAEGSDWCWWYGPEHATAQRAEFDQLYRDHLANVYRALGLAVPDELSRPISVQTEMTSQGASVPRRSGAMHMDSPPT